MTLSPPLFDMATISAVDDLKQDDDDDGAVMPSPISKPLPDMDDATPPPTNPRRQEETETPALTRDTTETQQDEPPPPPSHECSFDMNSNERQANTNEATVPSPPRPEEDPEAESIALARMLMEQEAIESYGALSADYLRYNSHLFSQQDLAALQAAMAEDEGSDNNEEDAEPFSYDVMLRLGESIGDVKKERWNLVASSQIAKLEEFPFVPHNVKDRDENDCNVKCLVCQFAYEPEETLKRLPCGHVFHSECVAQWLKDNDICPYCRQTIVDKNE